MQACREISPRRRVRPHTHVGNEYNLRGGIVELLTVMGLNHALHDHERISVGSIMCSRDITTRQAFFDRYRDHSRSVPEHDLTGYAFVLLRCDQLAGEQSNWLATWLVGLTDGELARIAVEVEAALWLLGSEKALLMGVMKEVIC